jgi:hypothetical protein
MFDPKKKITYYYLHDHTFHVSAYLFRITPAAMSGSILPPYGDSSISNTISCLLMSARCRLIGLSLESALKAFDAGNFHYNCGGGIFSEHAHAGLGPAWPDSSYFERCLVFHSEP